MTDIIEIHALKDRWERVPMLFGPDLLIHQLDASHGFAAVVRFTAGWLRASAVTCTADETFLILDGELTLNGTRIASGSLVNIPAGSVRASTHSAQGCTAVAWFSGVPRWASAVAGEGQEVVQHPLARVPADCVTVVGGAQWIVHDPLTASAVDADSELIDMTDGTWRRLQPGQTATPSPHRHVRRLQQ